VLRKVVGPLNSGSASAPRAMAIGGAWVHTPLPEMQASRGQPQLHPLFPSSPAVRNNITYKAKKTP